MRFLAAPGYVVVMMIVVLLVNANAENGWLAFGIWSVASLVLGWTTRDGRFALLAFLAIPIAIPFDYADEWLGSDAPLVWWAAAYGSIVEAVLVVMAAVARLLFERWRPSAN